VFRIKSGWDADTMGLLPQSGDNSGSVLLNNDKNALMGELRAYYKELLTGTADQNDEEMQAGYQAALQRLDEIANLFKQDSPPLEQIIYDILGRKPEHNERPSRKMVFQHGSAAEKIGILLFVMAMLQSGSLMADPSAEPIVILEDPEANLHPMTLQAVKMIIKRLRWQKVITTQSGAFLSDFPLHCIRRISRQDGVVRQFWVKPEDLSREELRRLSYHVRMRMSTATFARCWLLVEGESEVWLLPHIARLCGYDLTVEGIFCVEFAQCGISPLVKAATHLGVQWFLLADGDSAGKSYIETGKHFAQQAGENPHDRCMRFREPDIEHHLFLNGYSDIYIEYSGISKQAAQNMKPRRIINRAIHRQSKPFMAVAVVEAMGRNGSPGVPSQLKKLIETCVRLAKGI
jgi:putative ATP-dependent endonuclease of OLD family